MNLIHVLQMNSERDHNRAISAAQTLAAQVVLEGWGEGQFDILITNAWMDHTRSEYDACYYSELKKQKRILKESGLWNST